MRKQINTVVGQSLNFLKYKTSPYYGCAMLLSDGNEEEIKTNIFVDKTIDKETFEWFIPMLLAHEITHGLQYFNKIFLDEKPFTKIEDYSGDANLFDYLSQKSEIDAELSAYYYANKSFYSGEKKSIHNQVKSFYEQYRNYSQQLIEALATFVSEYVVSGNYNENLRHELKKGLIT